MLLEIPQSGIGRETDFLLNHEIRVGNQPTKLILILLGLKKMEDRNKDNTQAETKVAFCTAKFIFACNRP